MRKAAVLCAHGISCPGTDKRVQANENEYELFANDVSYPGQVDALNELTNCGDAISWNGATVHGCHKHVKNFLSSVFKVAKQKGFFDGVNPVTDTAINPVAPAAEETYAYSLEEIYGILAHLPEPAATAFAIAAYTGLRVGEIEGLD